MKTYSASIPAETKKALRKVVQENKSLRGLNSAALIILKHYQGSLAEKAVESMWDTLPYLDSELERLSMSISTDMYEELVEATRRTGIRRQRIVGVILVGCQEDFAGIIARNGTKERGASQS